jgi:hypothetical protein
MSYKIEYYIERDGMTDEEYEESSREIIMSQTDFEDIIYEWLRQNTEYDYDTEEIDRDNLYIRKN